MKQTFTIFRAGETVGEASVEREGLYCRVRCRCRGLEKKILRVEVRSEAGKVSLGVLIPNGDEWELETRIAAKRFGDDLRFAIAGEGEEYREKQETFVPVAEGEAFAYLDRLVGAHMAQEDGRIGVVIETLESSREEKEEIAPPPIPEETVN